MCNGREGLFFFFFFFFFCNTHKPCPTEMDTGYTLYTIVVWYIDKLSDNLFTLLSRSAVCTSALIV